MSTKKKRYYAVKVGRINNVITNTWEECSDLVTGHSGAIFKSFEIRSDAIAYAAGNYNPAPTRSRRQPVHAKITKNNLPCIERKTYTDTRTGEIFTNRCVRRRGKTITGKYYQPNNDQSVPWEE